MSIQGLIRKLVSEEMPKILDDVIRKAAEKEMMKMFERKPNEQLTKIGFDWALVLYFHHYWPNITRKEAVDCADDCMDVPYGTDGYDWSASAAKELVYNYVTTYGEMGT